MGKENAIHKPNIPSLHYSNISVLLKLALQNNRLRSIGQKVGHKKIPMQLL